MQKILLFLIVFFALSSTLACAGSGGAMDAFDQAKKEFHLGSPKLAAEMLERLLDQRQINNPPVVADVRLYLAACYAKMGDLKKAELELLDAEKNASGGQHDIVLASLLRCYLSAGKKKEALEVVTDLQEESPFNAERFASTAQVLRQWNKGEVDLDATNYFKASSYAASAIPPHGRTFKVWINPDVGLSNAEIFKQCLKNWSEASKRKVLFDLVKSPKEADIDINLEFFINPFDLEHGNTELKFDRLNQITHASIRIHTSTNAPASEDELRWTCLHEIGHAIGIAEHSCNSNDVMFICQPSSAMASTPSRRDAYTLRKLYSPSTSQQISNFIKWVIDRIQHGIPLIFAGILLLIIAPFLTFMITEMFAKSAANGNSQKTDSSISPQEMLQCSGSFFASLLVWFFITGMNFGFAAAIMAVLLFHEAGHYIAARASKVRASLPIFWVVVAFVRMEEKTEKVQNDFIVAAAGPFTGALAAGVCYAFASQAPWLAQVASLGFVLNLLQLTPAPPFDGGHMVRAIDRRLWFAGALLIAIYGFAELASGDLPAALACLPLFGVSFNYIRANLNAEQNEPSGTEKVLYALIYVLLTASLSYCCAQLAGAEF